MNPRIVRSVVLGALLLGSGACRRRTPPPPRDPNVLLHTEHAIGAPTIDIRNDPDAGSTHVQIGAASVNLPTREPEPPPTTE